MKDIEDRLKAATTRKPNENHRARMEALFEKPAYSPTLIERPVRLWQCLVACALCLLIGFGLARMTVHGTEPDRDGPSQQPATYAAAVSGEDRPFELVQDRGDGWIEITVLEQSE